MKLREVIKKAIFAMVAGVVVNSTTSAIFPRREFSLFPTLSVMVTIFIGSSSSYNLYWNVLLSNLIYTLACLIEFKLGISLVSLPFLMATFSLVVAYKKVNTSKDLIAVSNFPRLEKIYNKSKLEEKISLLKEKGLKTSVVYVDDLSLVEQIIKTRKFVAYQEGNSVKLLYEYSENLPNFSTKSVKKMQEVNCELILNEIYEKALPSPPSLTLPIGEKKVQVPSNYSRGKLVILDQDEKINLYGLREINKKNGWIELGRNQIVNFIKSRLFLSKATFSIITKDEPKGKVDLTILIRKDFQENEVYNALISVPRHSERLSRYLGFENSEPFNKSIILYSKKDGLFWLGDQK